MTTPVRLNAGFTQDAPYQPLGHIGFPNPFFYASFADDFIPYVVGKYTVTAASGSVAAGVANGPGGRILFTTGAVAGNFAEIQVISPGLQYIAGKKLAFLCRIRPTIITTSTFIAGLIETNTTPFTAVADGIYFSKAAGSSNLVLNVVTGSASIGTTTIIGALTAATDIDLGFYVDRSGNIKVFYGSALVGVKRQDTATLGPNAGILASALTGTLTAALLTPTIAFSNGATAAATTGAADFLYAAQER